tara:strand:- start:2458 stop:3150 length:693 start_codon:yes stop_codon:yes gene_type:complete
MIEDTDFETFLNISNNKYQIFVYDKNNSKNLYNEEIKNDNEIELNILSKFLDDNIYKIEKIIKNFIKNIIVIIEDDKVLEIGLSIKIKNYEKQLDYKYVKNSLIEAKNIFNENYPDLVIMHMLIVDTDMSKKLLSNSEKINDNYLYLEVNFICISIGYTHILDKLLGNHQIKIEQYMSGNYVKNFLGEDENKIPVIANKLNNGFNKNEVKVISKNKENRGFFERFFQLFS